MEQCPVPVPSPQSLPEPRGLRWQPGWQDGLPLPWAWAPAAFTRDGRRLYQARHPDGRETPPSQGVLDIAGFVARMEAGEDLALPPARHGAPSPQPRVPPPAPVAPATVLPPPREDGQLTLFS